MDVLTQREADVLRLILKGLDNDAISERLDRSVRTIEGVKRDLHKRFETHTTLGLIMESLQYGFLVRSIENYFNAGKYREPDEYLSINEHAVLREMLSGRTTPEIAKSLDLSERSVDHYRSCIHKKWNVDSPVDLVLKSIQKGYVKIFASTTELDINDSQQVWEAFQKSVKIKRKNGLQILYRYAFDYPNYFEKQLTRAQREVMYLRLHGKSNTQIASAMGIGEKSVLRHYAHARERLIAATPGEILKKSIGAGIITVIPALYSNNVLNEIEVPVIILLSDGMDIRHIARALQTTEKSIKETIQKLKVRYEVETIEGILLSALRKGHIRNLL